MDMNDILTLAKAGFTAAQIAAISQISAPAPTPAAPAPAPTPAAPAPAPTPAAPAPAPTPAAPATDPIMAELARLTGLMQANALINSNIPQNQQSTEDILAAIINPPALKVPGTK